MTIKELYDWAVANDFADAKLTTYHPEKQIVFEEVKFANYSTQNYQCCFEGKNIILPTANTVCLYNN